MSNGKSLTIHLFHTCRICDIWCRWILLFFHILRFMVLYIFHYYDCTPGSVCTGEHYDEHAYIQQYSSIE